jgi:hypothetical protein
MFRLLLYSHLLDCKSWYVAFSGEFQYQSSEFSLCQHNAFYLTNKFVYFTIKHCVAENLQQYFHFYSGHEHNCKNNLRFIKLYYL